MLELLRLVAVAVGLQEAPQRLADCDVANTALLHFRCPYGPVGDVGADLRNAEPGAPGFELIAAAPLAELRIAHGGGLVVEITEVRQDQPAGNQRVEDGAVGRRRPTEEAAQQW
jgi:hypothetical protein